MKKIIFENIVKIVKWREIEYTFRKNLQKIIDNNGSCSGVNCYHCPFESSINGGYDHRLLIEEVYDIKVDDECLYSKYKVKTCKDILALFDNKQPEFEF